MRQPLSDDHDCHQDVPTHPTTSFLLGRTTSSAYVPAPPQLEFPGYGPYFFIPLLLMNLIASTNRFSCIHYTSPQSSYHIDPSFLASSPGKTSYDYRSMPTMFVDPFAFGLAYSHYSFEVGGSSAAQQHGFHTL